MSRTGVRSAVLLVDNGTLEPAAIRRLRTIAAALAARLRGPVEPVSLLHSDRVPAEQIDGQAAEILEAALMRRCGQGILAFTIVPFFIGPTRALSDYLPQVIERVRVKFPALLVRVASPLHQDGDDRLAGILEAQVKEVLGVEFKDGVRPRVALVDHGSPVREVTQVRNRLALRLAGLLGDTVAEVAPCSMERRLGAEYDFNEPLLEKLLATPRWNAGPVVVAHLFLLPGRHAGAHGDIAQICAAATRAHPPLRIARTALLGDSAELVDLLAARFAAVGSNG
jgi:sirohydrochlorin ferrochelatase